MSDSRPGSTIGIIGGGQLGRMLAMAAAQLGYKCHIYAPDEAPPRGRGRGRASPAAPGTTRRRCAASPRAVDVATYRVREYRRARRSRALGRDRLRPAAARALEIAQDRLAEKSSSPALGGRPAPLAAVDDLAGLEAALGAIGTPAILKTRRFGYDGKGQARIARSGRRGRAPGRRSAARRRLLEGSCRLRRRILDPALPRGRRRDGGLGRRRATSMTAASWPLDRARRRPRRRRRSRRPRRSRAQVAEALDHVGVLTLEFFATRRRAGVQRDGAARPQQRPLDDRGRA